MKSFKINTEEGVYPFLRTKVGDISKLALFHMVQKFVAPVVFLGSTHEFHPILIG